MRRRRDGDSYGGASFDAAANLDPAMQEAGAFLDAHEAEPSTGAPDARLVEPAAVVDNRQRQLVGDPRPSRDLRTA
jgi:hypothetical protein